MQLHHLSKQDALTLLEIVRDSLGCNTEEEVRALMTRLDSLLPYEAAISCVSRMGPGGAMQDLKIVNVDYPSDYLKELGQQNLISKDPVVAENFKTFRLQYWQDTLGRCASSPDGEDIGRILSLAEDFGFKRVRSGWGYGHGTCNAARTEGSLFCYHGLPRSRRTEEILHLIVPHFHEALRRLDRSPTDGAILSRREVEVLNWLKEGKSTWDMSMILRISERTVKFHVGNILRKLDATTRAHAVAKALEQGLVRMD